jgi:hypothetical protein
MEKYAANSELFQSSSPRSGSVDSADRRKNNRYVLGALVAFQWRDSQGDRRQGAGFMRDVSISGLFVMTPTLPPVGTTIRLEMCLESSPTNSAITIHAKGQVCRVVPNDESGAQRGFAASTKRLKMHNHSRASV